MHTFHPHPICLVKQPDMVFTGTIDQDAEACFEESDVFRVVDAQDGLAFIELSPRHKEPHRGEATFIPDKLVRWARNRATQANRRSFMHRIVLFGEPEDTWKAEQALIPVRKELLDD